MDAERFPKPDVPWFHEMYPDEYWRGSAQKGRAVSDNGWECLAEPAGERPTCGVSTVHPVRGQCYCRLVPGHDGPHLGVEPTGERAVGRLLVTNLRRVARAEVA